MAFQLSVKFFLFFWWLFKISLFWHLGPESLNPQNTIKIGVSSDFFLETSCVSRNGRFWTKKTKIYKFQLSFFLSYFLLFQKQKNTKICWNPYFYSVLANLKKENFQNLNLKHRKLKNPIFAPFFWKRLFLENWQITGNKKRTQTDNWEPKKSPETPIFIV